MRCRGARPRGVGRRPPATGWRVSTVRGREATGTGSTRARSVPPSSRAAFRGLATLVLDEARAELAAALARPSLLSKTTAPIAFRMLLAVPPSHQKRVRKRIMATIEAIKRELKDCDKRSAPRWAMTLVFAPRISRKRSD